MIKNTIIGILIVIVVLALMPREIHIKHTTVPAPKLINKNDFDVEFLNIEPGEITLHRHINGVMYGCDETICKRIAE